MLEDVSKENETSVERSNPDDMGLVRNENVSPLQSSNVENFRKPGSENNHETIEDDLNTNTEETDAVGIVLHDSGVVEENLISVGGDLLLLRIVSL